MRVVATCTHCGGDMYRETWFSRRGVNVDSCRCGQCGSDGLLIHGPDGDTWQQGCVEAAGATPVTEIEELGCLRPLVGRIPGLEAHR